MKFKYVENDHGPGTGSCGENGSYDGGMHRLYGGVSADLVRNLRLAAVTRG